MLNQGELISEVSSLLKKKYGDKYQIATQLSLSSIEGVDRDSAPDIVLYDKTTDKVMLVEVKGSSASYDLPLGTIQALKKLKNVNSRLNPKILVVTPSNISTAVKAQLASEDIDLVQINGIADTLITITEYWDQYLSSDETNHRNNP